VASEDTISTSRLSDFFIEKVQSYEEEKFEDEQFRIAFEKFAKYREKSAIRNKGPLLPEFSALHKSFRPLQEHLNLTPNTRIRAPASSDFLGDLLVIAKPAVSTSTIGDDFLNSLFSTSTSLTSSTLAAKSCSPKTYDPLLDFTSRVR